MQMMMAAWTAQTISAVTRLGVADVLQKHGPQTAHSLTHAHGIDARPELLERALRACASVGVFTESADGRFGPTPLSEVLTVGAPNSVRRFVELIGGRWWPLESEDPAIRSRLTFVGGDMFVDVPPGDTYVLKTIVRDWGDASCVGVLRVCRAKLPAGGRIVCVDKVLPPMGDTSASGAKLLDMLMMVSLPGKERTEVEGRALHEQAGLTITAIRVTNPRSGESLIESVAG
jgi:hypothetical protein